MKKAFLFVTLLALATNVSFAQKSKTAPKEKTTKKTEEFVGFQSIGGGLEYKTIKDEPGENNPKLGDYVEVHLVTKVADSELFSTRKVNNNQPVQFQIQQPQSKGDLVEGLKLMTPGDSTIFLMSVDSIIKAGAPTVEWMKPGTGQKIVYFVTLVSVKSMDQMAKEQQEKSAAQKGIDDNIINDYLTKNNIKATKTESGLYYSISQEGKGAPAQPGDTAVVNYTGKTVEGKVFDSNVDPQFMHVEPFKFIIGMGQVIKGWDEGFMKLKKGTKGTLYIPSGLAYGPNSPDPSKIPANGVLIFDVELVNILSAARQAPEQVEMKKEEKKTKPAKKG